MPELPEVETVARGVGRHIAGLTVEWVHLERKDIVYGHPAPLCAALRGRRVQKVVRRGKQVHLDLVGGACLIVHLGMTGKLLVADRDEPIARHTHLRLTFRRRRIELRFVDPRRFGRIWLILDAEPDGPWIGRRPPPVAADPLRISLADFRDLLNRDRQIKALLLDQQPLSGVGNIYCDEALYRAGIHPGTRAADLDASMVGRLWRALRRVLNESIAAGGTTVSDYRSADNTTGWYQHKLRVYQRTGHPCRQCGTRIQRIAVAGRGTFICPQCQPVSRRRGSGQTPRRRL
ncbi:MAG: bifunctional DNA-formamidopyrimidine glycosylase/DNA-(apurinic or apyrimidinic site) lyase [Phycisphaerales bacterium]|nr:bifunctional DNA-formamidopyrimidine glycosylase/DNA-(apurinic or apyrimidinic site) lyase [Phycisphaerales bacterium]